MADDDLTRTLRLLRDEGPTFAAPPASDVRRRGERLRRRRQGLVAAGAAAAAVLAVAGPVALLGDRDRDSAPQPGGPTGQVSPTPRGDQATPPAAADPGWSAIPLDFPLAEGWPRASTEGPDYGLFGPEQGLTTLVDQVRLPCGGTPPDLEPTAQLAARWLAPADTRMRELLLFEDDLVAAAYADGLRDVFRTCPTEALSADDEVQVAVAPAASGFSVVQTSSFRDQPATGALVVRVVQVGNRVLIATADTEQADRALAVETVEQELGAVVELVGDDSPPEGAGPEPVGAGGGIPADFPLGTELRDWTGDGFTIRGPSSTAPGVERMLCGSSLWTRGAERLAVNATGPETGDYRELRVWPDAQAAVQAMQHLRTVLANCPVDPGTASVVNVHPEDTGYQDSVSFAVTGQVGLGGEIFQFTRVGRSVLAVSEPGEMLTSNAAQGLGTLTAVTRGLTPQMCLFTEAGC